MSSIRYSNGYIPPHLRHLHTVAPSKPAGTCSLLHGPELEQKALPPHLREPAKASPATIDTKMGSVKPMQDTTSPASTERRRCTVRPHSKPRAQSQSSASIAGMVGNTEQNASILIHGLTEPSTGGSTPSNLKPSESDLNISDQSLCIKNKADLAHLEPLIPRRRPVHGLDLDAKHTELELLPPRMKPLLPRTADKVDNTSAGMEECTSAEGGQSVTEQGIRTAPRPARVPPHLRGLEIPAVPTKNGESSSTMARSVGMVSNSKPGSSKATTSTNVTAVPEVQKIWTGDAALWIKAEHMLSAKVSKAHLCPYEDCKVGFDTIKLLNMHKEDRHDRCKKCNLDFKNFQEYLDHKIQSPEHITCPVCGQDFKSSGGRDNHVLAVS